MRAPTKSMSYEYLNTRVRLMLARLLTPAQFHALLELRSLQELTNALAETDYAPELQRTVVEFSGYELIEQTVLRNAQRAFSKLVSIAPEGPKLLIELLLERFEVFNLKTILRGYHARLSPAETARGLFPSLLYPMAFYDELLKRTGVREALDYLLSVGHRYYKPLAEVFPEYERTGKLALLEHSVDAFYFAHSRGVLDELRDENAQIVRTVLGTEVDLLNLIYALRLVEAGVRAEERYRYILDGGEHLSKNLVRHLLDSEDKSALLKKLERTDYHRALKALNENASVAQIQEHLENYLYREHSRLDKQDFFNIRMTIAYLWRKRAEMTNLRVIAMGLARRTARAQIEANLIPLEVFK
ncbi:MAG: V-type ATPase subunit [Candidatus Bipolaricaulota bacterium]|nr:V-type ATPase subunit [Candidatus Bipolaricaulota bacterium]